MKNEAAVELGKCGGLKRSERKTEACRRNARKPRTRLVSAIYFEVMTQRGSRSGLVVERGNGDKWNIFKNPEGIDALIKAHLFTGAEIEEILELHTRTQKI